MAVALRSVGVSPGANSALCVITKPAGLQVGDLMVAHVVGRGESITSFDPIPGWGTVGQKKLIFFVHTISAIFWKIADSGDVAASNFTFTLEDAVSNRGAITAWTGHNPLSPINAYAGDDNASSTTVTSPPITPSVADCLIMMIGSIVDDHTQSNYAIADDDPGGWSEAYDLIANLDEDLALAMGYTLRPETTSTGNGTCTVSAADLNIGQLVAIAPEVVITPKTSSDTGSGADAKASSNPLATYSRNETGSGVEAKASENPLGFLVKSETGSGLEHILDRIIFLTSESGSGLDIVLARAILSIGETGSGVENSYLHIIEGVKSSSDTGSGADISALTTLLQRYETGAGVEAVVARALYAKEYPTGALDLVKVLTAVITGTGETGTGAETSLQSFYQKKSDSGSGVDSSTLEALFSRTDTGAGAEAITLLAALIAHDTGQGIGTVLNYLRTLVDSGEGAEVVQLIGFVGRRMRMIVYQKEVFSLIVYTSEVGR